jgi:hypothetical protein
MNDEISHARHGILELAGLIRDSCCLHDLDLGRSGLKISCSFFFTYTLEYPVLHVTKNRESTQGELSPKQLSGHEYEDESSAHSASALTQPPSIHFLLSSQTKMPPQVSKVRIIVLSDSCCSRGSFVIQVWI